MAKDPKNEVKTEASTETPKQRSGHIAKFASKDEYLAFLDKVQAQNPQHWEQYKDELLKAAEGFDA